MLDKTVNFLQGCKPVQRNKVFLPKVVQRIVANVAATYSNASENFLIHKSDMAIYTCFYYIIFQTNVSFLYMYVPDIWTFIKRILGTTQNTLHVAF